MQTFVNQALPMIQTALWGLLLALVGVIVADVKKNAPTLMSDIVNLLKAKFGEMQYNYMRNIGIDIWNQIEEDGILNKLVDDKITTFTVMITARFPSITAADLELLRQSIAGVFNVDKAPVVQVIIPDPTTIKAVITKKFVDEDGKELVYSVNTQGRGPIASPTTPENIVSDVVTTK